MYMKPRYPFGYPPARHRQLYLAKLDETLGQD